MTTNLDAAPLDGLGLIGARGPDARKFLHGQLSQDVLALGNETVALAGFHNPQGRSLAILRLVPLAEDALLLVLPGEIVGAIIQRLRRYLLRSKLTLDDETAAWTRTGLAGPGAAAALAAAGLGIEAAGVGALARGAGRLAWRHAGAPERFIVLSPAAAGPPPGWPAAGDAAAARRWHAADVAAGLPEVHAATMEAFVAQMLNLDALGGISFTKGCYTGQEVIARAHYRGRVKRRLQRFRTLAAPAAPLRPGDAVTLADGRAARVVDAAALDDGRVEFLAVAPLATEGAADEDAAASSPGAAAPLRLECENLPLPYPLPA